ncbi:MAG: 2Fe-2S iron-sulfur cluster-binding protein [Candidatus Manganitrophus sp.]|nr:2Fe-2S iron-sulfur cluster-binding protein [Candidatus Manganitrophus sp.]MDC4223253.1 2Fe-2S iron-sulfur cluster-binding protein [Candidatus Manganitrophus sp.]WDT71645.1 MAG: 2Fe-2S iron-sulfur cluster-binding protein [Candidatus Manganitrophus sp.]WDT81007.1 MAG: 2Fe-2S iron-sulfur cluster-binding protein [Candidatus Manganitrophus sp.]
MSKVTFYPYGKSGEIPDGTSLLDAAEKLGLQMRHDCGGFATCSTCRIWVVEGMTNLTEIDLDEENMLEEAQLTAPFRLSCQAKIRGDVVVRVPDQEMEWSRGALRELDALDPAVREIIRMMVEKRARLQGLSAILPDTAIPFVADAKKEVEAVASDPDQLAALVKRIFEAE